MTDLRSRLAGIGKRVMRRMASSSVDAELLAVFLALALFGLLFMALASEVAEGDTLSLDHAVLKSLRDPGTGEPIGPRWLQLAMIDVTALGGVSVLTLLTAASIGYLLAARRKAHALFLLASTVGGALVGTLLKYAFVRPRPEIVSHLVAVDSLSFPSGHALNSAVIYLTLGALLARSEARPAIRIYIVLVAITLTLMIGVSRVFLGVHYPSDVLGGWCAGAAWAAACSSIARILQKRRALEAPGPAMSDNPSIDRKAP